MHLVVKTKVMEDCIPEKAQAKVIFNSRIYVAIWILNYFGLVNSCIPLGCHVLYFLYLPQYYGKTLHKLVAFTQHAGLARNIKDHRFSRQEKCT